MREILLGVVYTDYQIGVFKLVFRPSIVAIFQGRGVAASATSSQLKADAHRSVSHSGSNHQSGGMSFTSPSSGIKKSSLCLQTKFKIVSMFDVSVLDLDSNLEGWN